MTPPCTSTLDHNAQQEEAGGGHHTSCRQLLRGCVRCREARSRVMRDDSDGGCSPSGSRVLTDWNLDASGFRAIITIQGAKKITAVSPRGSLFFCGARLFDFHGLLVTVDPECDIFRLWDLDAGLVEGFGTRFLDQSDGVIWVSSFGSSLPRSARRGRGARSAGTGI